MSRIYSHKRYRGIANRKGRTLLIENLEGRELFAGLEPLLAGRSQDAFVVVDPTDEYAVRLAVAYQELRNIPDVNILFLEPPMESVFKKLSLPANEFWDDYVAQVHGAIQDRGLADQIDFIVAIGQPHSLSENGNFQSLSYALMQLEQYQAGMSVTEGQFVSSGIGTKPSTGALHHSDPYSVDRNGRQEQHRYYVAGFLAVTDRFGNSVDQAIAGLQRSVAADGTKPQGTIYFEKNNDVRSITREPQWDEVEAELSARGIPWVEEVDVSGGTPIDRSDVRGAVLGRAELTLPNGSQYIAASFADNLTSYGANFSPNQTKATELIAAGAAATSGTVEEPYAIAARFPHAKIYTAIDDGLTLGEAFYHSVVDPDMQQFIGDILAQPYADTPRITMTAAPENGSQVSGNVAIAVSAAVPSGGRATAVQTLELYLDGRLQKSLPGPSGLFSVDTRTLSDGAHEFRVVAISNNAAESEGIAIRQIYVNNQDRSIRADRQQFIVAARDTVQVPLTAKRGNGSISKVELEHLGRSVAMASGATASISLDARQLAFGDNRLTPIAVYADGQRVHGASFMVERVPEVIPGEAFPSASSRTPGIKAEYFLGNGGVSISESDFSGAPDIVKTHRVLNLDERSMESVPERPATELLDRLAVRFTGSFDVTEATAGEYFWTTYRTNDSVRLSVDGHEIIAYDNYAYGFGNADASASLHLGSGRHRFELLLANTGSDDPGLDVDVRLRGPNGVTRSLSDAFVYDASTSAVVINPPTLLSPIGHIDEPKPTVSWTAVPGAETYEVRVTNETSGEVVFQQTITATRIAVPSELAAGNYLAEVRTVVGDQRSLFATSRFSVAAEGYFYSTSYEEYTVEQWDIGDGKYKPRLDAYNEDVGDGRNIRLAADEFAATGRNALVITYTENEDRGQTITYIEPGIDQVHVEQKMYFAPSYDVGNGEKLFRVFSYNPTIDKVEFDYVIVMSATPRSGLPAGDLTGVNDSYWLTFGTNGSRHGREFEAVDGSPFVLERGHWYTFTADMQLNTPGQANGSATLKVDGQVIANLQGILIRKEASHLINRVLIGGWYSNGGGGNPSPLPASRNLRYIDDVTISERPLSSVPPVKNEPLASLDLSLVDRNGNALREVRRGEEFYLDVFAEDLRSPGAGVFSASLDVEFNSALAQVIQPITFGTAYPHDQHGDSTKPGLLDEIGAAGLQSSVGARNLLARIPLRSTGVGQITFTANPADQFPEHEVSLIGLNKAVPTERVKYATVQLAVHDSASEWHNSQFIEDVNGDGHLSPIDALLIINLLNLVGTRPLDSLDEETPKRFIDINDDGQLTPLDALLVINALNARAQVISGESGGIDKKKDNESIDPAVDVFFTELG